MPINHIVDLVGKKLSEINYSKDNLAVTPNFNGVLKQSLLQGDPDFKIKLINKSQFTVEIPSSAYSEMLYTDFFYGLQRIQKLHDEIEFQKSLPESSAWLIVTTYYASFFSAIELSKVLGRFNLNLDSSQQEVLANQSTEGIHSNFITGSSVSFVGQACASTNWDLIKITFSSGGGKPHKLAWDNLYFLLKSINFSSDSKRYISQQRFIDIISSASDSRWAKPSDVRNKWNYSDPRFFSKSGIDFSKAHKSIVGDYNKTFNWASTRKLQPTEENEATSIAFIYTILINSIFNIKDKILI